MAEISIQTTQNVEIRYKLAHIGDRILSALIDSLIIIVYTVLMAFLVEAFFSLPQYFFVILLVPSFFYAFFFETFFNGQSIGKMALNIKVISLDGSQPRIGQYFIRWVFRLIDISLSMCTVGVLTIILSEKGQRLGDIVAGTAVIKLTQQLSHSDIVPARVKEQYKITFLQALNLTSDDIGLIREVMDAYYYEQNYEVLSILAEKLKSLYHIETDMPHEKFLKTLLDDHANASYNETGFSSWKN